MTKRFKGKISGLRDQVGSPGFKLGLKLLGVLSLLGVADLCNCFDNKEQRAQY